MNTNATNPLCVIFSLLAALAQGIIDIALGFLTLTGQQVPQISDYLGSLFGCNV